MISSEFVGTGRLVRFILRRDRWRIPLWVGGLAVLPVATVNAYVGLYPTLAERAGLDAQFGASKAIAIITGPVRGLSTAGGFTQWRLGASVATILALLAIFAVVRHTRAEEESGRADLIRSTTVGRLAPLTAAVTAAGGTCLLAGAGMAAGLVAVGEPVPGSVGFGTGAAACGLVFTGVAALTVQLSSYGRTANGMASAVLGGAYLLRGVGDSSDGLSWLSWLSPVGWSQQLRPYAGERWWVLLLPAMAVAGLLAVAAAFARRRDVGEGWLGSPTGPAGASPMLSSTWGLAARTHRGILIGWAVSVIVMGLLFGAMTKTVAEIATSSPQMEIILERMGGAQAISQTFINIVSGMVGMILCCYAVQAILRIRHEEALGHAELILATGTSRWSWAGSHLAFAAAGAALLMLLVGLATGGSSALTDGGLPVGRIIGSALAQVPAIWIVTGVALAIIGWLPRLSAVAWALAALVILLGLFGPILDLPAWVLDVSPFTSAPTVDGGPFDWTTLLLQICFAVALMALGLLSVRRRDIPS